MDPLPGTCDRLDKAQAVQGGGSHGLRGSRCEAVQVGSRQTEISSN